MSPADVVAELAALTHALAAGEDVETELGVAIEHVETVSGEVGADEAKRLSDALGRLAEALQAAMDGVKTELGDVDGRRRTSGAFAYLRADRVGSRVSRRA